MTTMVQRAEIAYKDYLSYDRAFDYAKELLARGDEYSKKLGSQLMKESLQGQKQAMEAFKSASEAARKEGKGAAVDKFKVDAKEFNDNINAASAIGIANGVDVVSATSRVGSSGLAIPRNEATPEPPPQAPKKKKSFWEKLGDVLEVVAVVAAVALVVTACVVTCGAAVPGVVAAAGMTTAGSMVGTAGTLLTVASGINTVTSSSTAP